MIRRFIFLYLMVSVLIPCSFGQDTTTRAEPEAETPTIPETVEVEPLADDSEIATRILRILEATDWFNQPTVRVDEGVVFLGGTTDAEEHRDWAEKLAGKTRDVVAVVNQIEIVEPSVWDLSPTWGEMRELAGKTLRALPLVLLGLLFLAITILVARWTMEAASNFFRGRIQSSLLREVAARVLAVPVFVIGLYVVLKISGLTGMAATVLGGTGLLGLIIGFAFRDIAENFLSSVLLSMQRPFAKGDLIQVAGHEGYVQSVTSRSTLLMTREGNHVQIPNATIYKETIINFTANPRTRFEFTVGIGYDDSVSEAQSIALEVLREHPTVVDDPEPLVLADELGAATVNLRVLFWIDISEYSGPKVRSSVIRMVKHAFEDAGISMPDEAREVVFPDGVPVEMMESSPKDSEKKEAPEKPVPTESATHSAEGDLSSDAEEIEAQARSSRSPEEGANLLEEE